MIPITITYTPYAEGVKIIGVTGRAAEIRIPDHIDGLPVIAIAPYAFAVQTEAEVNETETPAQLSFVEGEDMPRKAPLKEVTGEALEAAVSAGHHPGKWGLMPLVAVLLWRSSTCRNIWRYCLTICLRDASL